jgi:hypothetical protein
MYIHRLINKYTGPTFVGFKIEECTPFIFLGTEEYKNTEECMLFSVVGGRRTEEEQSHSTSLRGNVCFYFINHHDSFCYRLIYQVRSHTRGLKASLG